MKTFYCLSKMPSITANPSVLNSLLLFPGIAPRNRECLLSVNGISKCLPALTHPPEALHVIISSLKINWKNTTENLQKQMLNPPEWTSFKGKLSTLPVLNLPGLAVFRCVMSRFTVDCQLPIHVMPHMHYAGDTTATRGATRGQDKSHALTILRVFLMSDLLKSHRFK